MERNYPKLGDVVNTSVLIRVSPLHHSNKRGLHGSDIDEWQIWKKEHEALQARLQKRFKQLSDSAAVLGKVNLDGKHSQHIHLNHKLENHMQEFEALIEYFISLNSLIVDLLQDSGSEVTVKSLTQIIEKMYKNNSTATLPSGEALTESEQAQLQASAVKEELSCVMEILNQHRERIVEGFLIPNPGKYIRKCSPIVGDHDKLIRLFIAKSNLMSILKTAGLKGPLALSVAQEYFAHEFLNIAELNYIISDFTRKALKFIYVIHQIPHLIQQMRYSLPVKC